MLNCRRGNIKKFVCAAQKERKKERWKVLYSTFILFMYSWIFYTEATQNKYLNNIRQCNIELVQYFGFQEIFSFLSSTFFFFLVQPWLAFAAFPWPFIKKYSHRAKIPEGHSESWHVGGNGTLRSVCTITEGQIFSIF